MTICSSRAAAQHLVASDSTRGARRPASAAAACDAHLRADSARPRATDALKWRTSNEPTCEGRQLIWVHGSAADTAVEAEQVLCLETHQTGGVQASSGMVHSQ